MEATGHCPSGRAAQAPGLVAVEATMSPWTHLIAAASAGAFGLYLWFLSQFEGRQTRIFVVLGTLLAIVSGWMWTTMGVEMVVLALASGGVVGLLLWLANELWESAVREREKREQDEQNKRWLEEEKLARARRQEEQDKRRAEERRQEDARRAAEDEARRAKEQREAEVRRQEEERERYRAEYRRRQLEAEEAKLAEIMKDLDPDTPMF
jgi:DNA segregation ATPase FtsK/SpoIIIE-like protein